MMRCHICDKQMKDQEIKGDEDRAGKLLPCGKCLDVVQRTLDAFKSPLTPQEEEAALHEQQSDGEVPILDGDVDLDSVEHLPPEYFMYWRS